jgi:hypothetical protein
MASALGVERSRKRHRSWRRRRHWGPEPNAIARELLLIVGGPLMFVLLFALFGPGWAFLVSLLAVIVVGARSIDTSQKVWHHVEVDHSKQFRWFGRLVLLFSVFAALAYSVPWEKYQEWAAIADNPKPTDCGPFSGCHYEPVFHHVNEPGQRLTVEWLRLND